MKDLRWGLLGGLILAVCLGVRQTFGLFLEPLAKVPDIGVGTFALAIAWQNLILGASQPFIGYVADRYGAAPVIALGAAAYGVGLAMMGLLGSPFGLMVGGGLLIGLAIGACGFSITLSAVGRLTSAAERSRNLGVASALGSFGQFALPPLAYWLINAWGWSNALLLLIPLTLAMMAAGLNLPKRPSAHPCASFAPPSLASPSLASPSLGGLSKILANAFRHRGFLLISLGFTTCGFHVSFIATHLPAYGEICGAAPVAGAAALSIVGFFNIVGTFLAGHLGGLYSKTRVLAGIYLLRAISIAVLLCIQPTPTIFLIFAAVEGFLWLATVPLTSGFIGEAFGTEYLATLFGLTFLCHQVGAFFGAWLGGKIFALTGTYDIMWVVLVILALIAMMLHLMIKERPAPLLSTAPP